jgi:hypothetical protein
MNTTVPADRVVLSQETKNSSTILVWDCTVTSHATPTSKQEASAESPMQDKEETKIQINERKKDEQKRLQKEERKKVKMTKCIKRRMKKVNEKRKVGTFLAELEVP